MRNCAFSCCGEATSDPHTSLNLHAPQKTWSCLLSKSHCVQLSHSLFCVTLLSLWSHSSVSLLHMEQALSPFFSQQYLRVGICSGLVDYQWCGFAFFFCLQARGRSIIEKSAGPFSCSSKSFAYILCFHTNHQLSGLAVFVLGNCMTIAVRRLILAATVKESRNFHFGMHVTMKPIV